MQLAKIGGIDTMDCTKRIMIVYVIISNIMNNKMIQFIYQNKNINLKSTQQVQSVQVFLFLFFLFLFYFDK